MNLFNEQMAQNILPYDGDVFYYGKILNAEESSFYYQKLLDEIPWKNDKAIIFGKEYITKRKVAWFGDQEYHYTYSGITKKAHVWNPILMGLKQKVEGISKTSYNSCLLNLYHSGAEGMGWHSDDEKTLLPNGAIASLTLGSERKFSFKHKTNKDKVDILLENGSLLVMKGTTQRNWMHKLPPTKKVFTPRINLTFRTIIL